MDFMTFVWVILGIGILSSIGRIMFMNNVVSGGAALQQKFISLGDMKGKTLDEISEVVGKPTGMSNMESMGTIYQWHAHGYNISLLFIDGVCDRIVNEFAA